ncbi:hypothetical protein Tco_0205197, partial [Tanacetum coccineum]
MKENQGGCVEGCVMKRTKEVVAGGGGQRRRWLEKDGDGGGDVQPGDGSIIGMTMCDKDDQLMHGVSSLPYCVKP